MSYWWKSEWADMLGEPHDLDHGDFDSMGVYPYCVALPFDSPTELKRPRLGRSNKLENGVSFH